LFLFLSVDERIKVIRSQNRSVAFLSLAILVFVYLVLLLGFEIDLGEVFFSGRAPAQSQFPQ